MGNQEIIEAFWRGYLSSLPAGQRPVNENPPEAWGFGKDPKMADQLGELVYNGVKTATSSLLWSYEAEGGTLPQAGDLSIHPSLAREDLYLSVFVNPDFHAWLFWFAFFR